MRGVVDTSVLISGLFWRGAPARVLDAWRDARFELVISKDVFDEYMRVADELRAKRRGVDPRPFLRIVFAAAIMVDAPKLVDPCAPLAMTTCS